jgi:hypothetical protein
MNPAMLSVPDSSKQAGDNRTIGRILLQLGKLKPEDAERVSHYQKECGLRFGEAAQLLGLVSEADVRMGLAISTAGRRGLSDRIGGGLPAIQSASGSNALRAQRITAAVVRYGT